MTTQKKTIIYLHWITAVMESNLQQQGKIAEFVYMIQKQNKLKPN